MAGPRSCSYGSWRSPITAELIAGDSNRLSEVALDGADVYWIEGRPREKGRCVLMRKRPDGGAEDLTPPPFSVRSRVHEYGGGAYAVDDGNVYFVNAADQRLWAQLREGGPPQPLSPEGPRRYADISVDRSRQRIVAVFEDHSDDGQPPRNGLASIPLDGSGDVQEIASGHDFYANPRVSPDGTTLAWLSWDLPDMPWDRTALWVAEVAGDGDLGVPRCLVGADGPESVFQPEWAADGALYFVSDRSGWWNLYRSADGCVLQLTDEQAELGLPQWVFGLSTYAFLDDGSIACSWARNGASTLAVVPRAGGRPRAIDIPFRHVRSVRASRGRIVFLGGSPSHPTSVVAVQPDTGRHDVLRRSCALSIEPGYLSHPEPIVFPTSHGEVAHALLYAPSNPHHVAPSGELPPLIVVSHGGPTGSADLQLDLRVHFWTSRGFAVVDVNYRGSTGYGRAYRERLNGHWGILDVDDCTNAALQLVRDGKADPDRLIIRGGSAGGFTTLAALTFRDLFAVGASYYGVSDLCSLAADTHKFEARYLDRLVGPWPASRSLYEERSPARHAERLSCPVIFFQGEDDKVVPPDQSSRMAESLRGRGIPVAIILYKGEQHGFRQAATIQRSLEAELYFYSRVLGFSLSDPVPIPPVRILG